MICCGHERKSPFCPECGAKLREDNPILELLQHCRATEKRGETAAKHKRGKAKYFENNGNLQQSKLHAEEAVIWGEMSNKWKQRGDALAELLQQQKDLSATKDRLTVAENQLTATRYPLGNDVS